ncbi:Cytochrome p450 [Thalictrum thalictroides]|uniref:Cytochrome p450 n=1 Tax=Thalictrum thalictroides TaxID=46969 RepID=A0A7J6XC54_THATH|nr:Cytochrome p450 [Thalictrum thalictroides]
MDFLCVVSLFFLFKTIWPELFLACLSFFAIRWYLNHKHNVFITRYPILDLLPALLQNLDRVHEWSVDVSNFLGSTLTGALPFYRSGQFFGTVKMLYTCDPRNVEYMVKTNFSNYPKGVEFLEVFNLIGDGIFNVDFEPWHAQRRMAHSLLTSKEFRNFISTVNLNLVQNELLPLLTLSAKKSSVVDLEDVFLRYAFDSIFTVIFGKTSNCLSSNSKRNEFEKAIDDGTEATFFRNIMPAPLWKLLRFLKLGTEKQLAQARETIDFHLSQYISTKRDELLNGNNDHKDLLAAYMKSEALKECLSSDKNDKFLKDTVFSFLFAGRDTSGTSLTWLFWLISKTPRVEKKLLEELKSVLAKKKNFIMQGPWVLDAEDLKGLVYLHAALSEALRLYPPIPLNRKSSLNKDVLPDGTVVKPRTLILFSMYAMARMEWVWGKDCYEFKPERWIDADGKLRHEPMSKFFVFNQGPRTCVGKEMAFTQIKLAAAAVLLNFHVQVVEGHEVVPKASLALHTKNGLLVKLKERIHS